MVSKPRGSNIMLSLTFVFIIRAAVKLKDEDSGALYPHGAGGVGPSLQARGIQEFCSPRVSLILNDIIIRQKYHLDVT